MQKNWLHFFPKRLSCLEHYADYGELLAHVFFAEAINEPLFLLLQSNIQSELIFKYCNFIEKMYFCGDADVQNVVDVTIVERLSDKHPSFEDE